MKSITKDIQNLSSIKIFFLNSNFKKIIVTNENIRNTPNCNFVIIAVAVKAAPVKYFKVLNFCELREEFHRYKPVIPSNTEIFSPNPEPVKYINPGYEA